MTHMPDTPAPPVEDADTNNGTELVCIPFGDCQPCPNDQVRKSPSPLCRILDIQSQLYGLVEPTILQTIRQPPSHALRPSLLATYNPYNTHSTHRGRDPRLGVLWSYPCCRTLRLFRVHCLQPRARRSRTWCTDGEGEEGSADAGGEVGGEDWVGEELTLRCARN
jgi:hypothetical protein